MKKPNITKGEWWYDDENYVLTNSNKNNPVICDADFWLSKEEVTANVKAISAVPDMIDALIVTHKFMVEHGWRNIQECKQVEQALKKAGCTE